MELLGGSLFDWAAVIGPMVALFLFIYEIKHDKTSKRKSSCKTLLKEISHMDEKLTNKKYIKNLQITVDERYCYIAKFTEHVFNDVGFISVISSGNFVLLKSDTQLALSNLYLRIQNNNRLIREHTQKNIGEITENDDNFIIVEMFHKKMTHNQKEMLHFINESKKYLNSEIS